MGRDLFRIHRIFRSPFYPGVGEGIGKMAAVFIAERIGQRKTQPLLVGAFSIKGTPFTGAFAP